jgi:hypothetical protein
VLEMEMVDRVRRAAVVVRKGSPEDEAAPAIEGVVLLICVLKAKNVSYA